MSAFNSILASSTSHPPPPFPCSCSPFQEAPSFRLSPCSSRSPSCDGSHPNRCWIFPTFPSVAQENRQTRSRMSASCSFDLADVLEMHLLLLHAEAHAPLSFRGRSSSLLLHYPLSPSNLRNLPVFDSLRTHILG